MQFRVRDPGPVCLFEGGDDKDDGHIVPGYECAEELGRSKPGRSKPNTALWLATEFFVEQSSKALHIKAPSLEAPMTPRMTFQKSEFPPMPKVLAGALPKAVVADAPLWDRPKISCARGFTVPAMPSLKARAQLSMRHWRGSGCLRKHKPASSPTSPMPEGNKRQEQRCDLGPEMFDIGTPVPMWDPFCKLSTGLDSQSRQPAPCMRPSESVLRKRRVSRP